LFVGRAENWKTQAVLLILKPARGIARKPRQHAGDGVGAVVGGVARRLVAGKRTPPGLAEVDAALARRITRG
jgi:hypothetical protein